MTTQPLHVANKTKFPSRGGGTLPPPVLACTRFNNKTWQEYQDWLNTNQQTYEQTYQRPLKCIYGTPREISHKKIPAQAKILVIEMNNDENKIEGIGEIINQTASEVYRIPSSRVVPVANAHSTPPSEPASISHPLTNRAELPPLGGGHPLSFRKIFSDRNYTRYIYIGNTHYATREELERNHTPDAQYINKQLEGLLPPTANYTTAATTTPTTIPHHTPHPPSNSTVGQCVRRNHPPSRGGGTPMESLLFKGARHMKRGSGITRCHFV